VIFTNGNIQLVGPKAKIWVTLVITTHRHRAAARRIDQSPSTGWLPTPKLAMANIELDAGEGGWLGLCREQPGTIAIANVLTNSAIIICR